MFDPIPRTRPVDAVTGQLRSALLSGSPAAGETLPPERELAASLGVSRLTLRAALARLEAEGLVRARQGDGVRVLDPQRHATLDVLAHLDPEARPELFAAFLELRRVVAVEAVALACVRMSDPAVDAVAALVELQRAERDDRAWDDRDLAISRAVLEGAGNFAFVLLLNSVEGVYRAHPRLAAALRGSRALALGGYDVVLALLRSRDAEAARRTLRPALEALDASAVGGAR